MVPYNLEPNLQYDSILTHTDLRIIRIKTVANFCILKKTANWVSQR